MSDCDPLPPPPPSPSSQPPPVTEGVESFPRKSQQHQSLCNLLSDTPLHAFRSLARIVKGPEDEATLTAIITEAVIKSVEKLFLNPGNGISQSSLRLKDIAINWLFLYENSMASLRRINDHEKTNRYMSMLSNSRIPIHLISWVISQGEVIRDADALRNLTPACFIGATFVKHQEEFDQDVDMADENIVSSLSILSSTTRKCKEERQDKVEEKKVKLFKHSTSTLKRTRSFNLLFSRIVL